MVNTELNPNIGLIDGQLASSNAGKYILGYRRTCICDSYSLSRV